MTNVSFTICSPLNEEGRTFMPILRKLRNVRVIVDIVKTLDVELYGNDVVDVVKLERVGGSRKSLTELSVEIQKSMLLSARSIFCFCLT